MLSDMKDHHVVLSGCSGGGKSTLLAELGRRGFKTVEEPGRRIVAEEMRRGGNALPWVDLEAFARRAIEMASFDRECAKGAKGWVFFDRGLLDAAAALEYATGIPVSNTLSGCPRFHRQVFLTPPWAEIYQSDAERQQGMEDGINEHHRLLNVFGRLGYEVVILPKSDVQTRADFVVDRLS